MATDAEQAEIIAGRDFRAVSPKADSPAAIARLPNIPVSEHTIPVPEPVDVPSPFSVDVQAGMKMSMDVQLGRIPAGNPNVVEFDNPPTEHKIVPLDDQFDAIERIEAIEELREKAEQLAAEWKPTMNRDTLKQVIKKRLIQIQNAADQGQIAPTDIQPAVAGVAG
jgi:hypothetical protein